MSRNIELQGKLDKYLTKGRYNPAKSEQVRQHYKQTHPIVLKNSIVVVNHVPVEHTERENASKFFNKLFGVESK
jgi:hypothetical protein